MSLANLSPNYTGKRLDLVELPNKIPLVISNEVLDKIKYLCKNIPKVEWSGPLFYTFEGSIQNPETFKIHVKDILPLDMGTGVYTSYQIDNRFIDYMEEDEQRMDWSMGHCHSHNTMGVFFSGTDTQELIDNAGNYNFYVSLIVNNFMEMVARIAFIAKVEHAVDELPYIASDEDGKPYTIQTAKVNITKEKLFYYECEVISEREIISVDDKFSWRVAEIMKPKPAPKVVYNNTPKSTTTPAYVQRAFPDPKKGKFKDFSKNFAKDFDFSSINIEDELDDEEDYNYQAIEYFGAALFKFIGEPLAEDTLTSVLEEWDSVDNKDELDIANTIMSRYSDLYAAHFPNADDKDFISNTYELIDMLYDEETAFPFIKATNRAILQMVKNFEKIQK